MTVQAQSFSVCIAAPELRTRGCRRSPGVSALVRALDQMTAKYVT